MKTPQIDACLSYIANDDSCNLDDVKARKELETLSSNILALFTALKYARRFLNPKDHDTRYVDEIIEATEVSQKSLNT